MQTDDLRTKGIIRRNIGPVLHMIRTFPGMAFEFLLIPIHYIRQEKDWRALVQQLPAIENFLSSREAIEASLLAPYRDYVANYSSPLISLSLNRAAFLDFLARISDARQILDLGSGFSSYVFRNVQKERGRGMVISVDDSHHWLNDTRRFLKRYQLSGDHLRTLDEMSDQEGHFRPGEFDLCFVDIGDIYLRVELLRQLLHYVKEGVIVVIDDFHVTWYRKQIVELCSGMNLDIFSLRKVTRRRLSHAALIMQRKTSDAI